MHHQRFAHLGAMVNTGSRAARASARTMPICFPRRRSTVLQMPHQIASLQDKSVQRRCGHHAVNRRRIDRQVMVLPEPDSPTRPSVSPARTWKLTPLTALTRHAVKICVRSRDLKQWSGASGLNIWQHLQSLRADAWWIQAVTQPIPGGDYSP